MSEISWFGNHSELSLALADQLDSSELLTLVETILESSVKCRTKEKYKLAATTISYVCNLLGLDWSLLLEENKLDLAFTHRDIDESLKDEARLIICRALFDLSITYYYCVPPEQRYKGLTICQTIQANSHVITPDYQSMLRLSHSNMLFYVQPWPEDEQQIIRLDIALPLTEPGSEHYYQPMNPSIVRCDNGYLVNLRTVNYNQERTVHWHIHDQKNIVRTKNYLLGLSNEYKILWHVPVVDNSPTTRFPTGVLGLEDCRLFWADKQCGDVEAGCFKNGTGLVEEIKEYEDEEDEDEDGDGRNEHPDKGKGKENELEEQLTDQLASEETDSEKLFGLDLSKVYFSCTTADTRLVNGVRCPQISVGCYNRQLVNGQASVAELIPMIKAGMHTRVEKNWLPFIDDAGKQCFIYDCKKALEVVDNPVAESWKRADKFTPRTGQARTILRKSMAIHFEDIRGSASPVRCSMMIAGEEQDVWLVCVHSVITKQEDDGWTRWYQSYFICFDPQWKVLAYTKAFYFKNFGVEYCAGMCLSHDQQSILCTFGVEDCEAYISIIKLSDLSKHLLLVDDLRM